MSEEDLVIYDEDWPELPAIDKPSDSQDWQKIVKIDQVCYALRPSRVKYNFSKFHVYRSSSKSERLFVHLAPGSAPQVFKSWRRQRMTRPNSVVLASDLAEHLDDRLGACIYHLRLRAAEDIRVRDVANAWMGESFGPCALLNLQTRFYSCWRTGHVKYSATSYGLAV